MTPKPISLFFNRLVQNRGWGPLCDSVMIIRINCRLVDKSCLSKLQQYYRHYMAEILSLCRETQNNQSIGNMSVGWDV